MSQKDAQSLTYKDSKSKIRRSAWCQLSTVLGLSWRSSGYDSVLPMQGAQVQSLVRELDPMCHS